MGAVPNGASRASGPSRARGASRAVCFEQLRNRKRVVLEEGVAVGGQKALEAEAGRFLRTKPSAALECAFARVCLCSCVPSLVCAFTRVCLHSCVASSGVARPVEKGNELVTSPHGLGDRRELAVARVSFAEPRMGAALIPHVEVEEVMSCKRQRMRVCIGVAQRWLRGSQGEPSRRAGDYTLATHPLMLSSH